MLQLPPALAPLGAREQFVAWIAVPSERKPGKLEKYPLDWRTGAVVDAHDRQFWTSFVTAAAMAPAYDRGYGCGAGFVFTEEDDLFFLDGDSMLQADGQWSPLAHELTARLGGAACEVSVSGKGLHWFGRYTRRPEHGTKNTPAGLELYTAKRFVALTGIGATGDVNRDCTAELEAIVAAYFPPVVGAGEAIGWTSEPVDGFTGPADDDDLLRKAMAAAARNAAAAFGGDAGPTFADLWEGRADVLARWRPDAQAARGYDASHADMALANHLAFWTGKNCERMERLMRRSGLLREKWDAPAHRNYLSTTILKACAFVGKVATGPVALGPTAPGGGVAPTPPPLPTEGGRDPNREYMLPVDQIAHFDGCYFLSDQARVFVLSRNEIMPKASFDVVFGGYLFVVDPQGRKTTDSAYDAFTKSRVLYPKVVAGLCFRPEIEPGVIVTVGGRALVNSYVPYDCPLAEGDPAPFLAFVEKLIPSETDRAILLAYIAALAQMPGRKFQWWPVLQGVQGNGKTLIISLMTYILGEHYCHLPNAHAMAKDGLKFNSWIERKLFVGIEEISLSNKRDFLDEFKVIVTNLRIPLEGKGKDQTNADNRANGILCTNHKAGVPITTDERRYAIFYTAQQTEADLTRCGMSGDYFPDLYDWFYGRNKYAALGANHGAAVMARYLKGYAIPVELNPAVTLMRAPKTSSTVEALGESLGRAELEILEAIEEGRPGFAGGWVSSKYLDELLERVRAPVPRNKRKTMMESLGYSWHPALREGRVNDTVTPDMGKPKLYLRAGHLAFNLADPLEIARAYSRAQEPAPVATAAARAFG